MLAIALLVLGTICSALLWIMGFGKMVCALGDNALRAIQFGGPLLLVVSGLLVFKGHPTAAGDLLYWTAVIIVGVLPVVWAIGDALVFRKHWLLLPIVASVTSLAAGLAVIFS